MLKVNETDQQDEHKFCTAGKTMCDEEQNLGVPSSESAIISELNAAPSTPRPWRVYDYEGHVGRYPKDIIASPSGESIAVIEGGWPQCTLAENEANAELIVHCVNLFPTMIAALQKIYDCGSISEAKRVAASALALVRGSRPERETETQQG